MSHRRSFVYGVGRFKEKRSQFLNLVMEHETVGNLIVGEWLTDGQKVVKIAQDFEGKLDLFRAGFALFIEPPGCALHLGPFLRPKMRITSARCNQGIGRTILTSVDSIFHPRNVTPEFQAAVEHSKDVDAQKKKVRGHARYLGQNKNRS